MFNFPILSSIIFKHSHKESWGWSDAKKLCEGLCLILFSEAKGNFGETFFNKFFNGTNKGGNFYKAIMQDEVKVKGFSLYIFDVEKRFKDANNREKLFPLHRVLKEIHEVTSQSSNLSGSIQKGLMQSYLRNHENRPYLFLAECLFYSLEIQKMPLASYKEISFDQEVEIVSNSLSDVLIDNKKYSSRTIHDLNMLSAYEVALFKKIAPFTFFDEAFDELSGEYVRDQQLISHEEFFELYETYKVKAVEISKLRECRLISGGGRHELVIEKGYLSGFQNNEFVLAVTTEEERLIFDYKAFHLTQSAIDLMEILEINYNNDFFIALKECFKERLKDKPVTVSLMEVKEF